MCVWLSIHALARPRRSCKLPNDCLRQEKNERVRSSNVSFTNRLPLWRILLYREHLIKKLLRKRIFRWTTCVRMSLKITRTYVLWFSDNIERLIILLHRSSRKIRPIHWTSYYDINVTFQMLSSIMQLIILISYKKDKSTHFFYQIVHSEFPDILLDSERVGDNCFNEVEILVRSFFNCCFQWLIKWIRNEYTID